jgi:hypothetical protein
MGAPDTEVGPAYSIDTSSDLAKIRAELGNFTWH